MKGRQGAASKAALEEELARERQIWNAKRNARSGAPKAGNDDDNGEGVTYEQIVAKQGKSNLESLQSSLSAVAEAQKMGADTLIQLQMQREQLLRVDDDLHQINCSLARSERHLRAIRSFRGSLTNMISKPLQEIDQRFRGKNAAPAPSKSEHGATKGKVAVGASNGNKNGDWGEEASGEEVMDIPEYIHTGEEIERLKIADALRAKGVAMVQGPNGQQEVVLYHYCNTPKVGFLVRDETSECVVITNQRLIRVEESVLRCEISLRRVKEVTLDRSKLKVRFEQLVVTSTEGDQWGDDSGKTRKDSVGIWNSDVAVFFHKLLSKMTSDLKNRRGFRTLEMLDEEAKQREAAVKRQLLEGANTSGGGPAASGSRRGGAPDGTGGTGGMDGGRGAGMSKLESDFDAARQEEDAMLDTLSGALQDLGSQAQALNTELKDQEKLIEHIDGRMEATNARVVKNTRETDKILGKDKVWDKPDKARGAAAAAAAPSADSRRQELEARRDAIRKKLAR